MGVSKNRGGPPKWMVYKAKAYQNGWFGGVPLFSETSIYNQPFLFYKPQVLGSYPALLGIKPGQDLREFCQLECLGTRIFTTQIQLDLMEKNRPPVEQKLSGDENGSAGKCRWLLNSRCFFQDLEQEASVRLMEVSDPPNWLPFGGW